VPTEARPTAAASAAGAASAPPSRGGTRGGDKAAPGGVAGYGARSARLQLHSDQLGDFIYDVHLTAVAPSPEPAVALTAALGQKASTSVRFRHFEPKAAVYKCVVSRPDAFTVPATVSAPVAPVGADAWEGAECAFDVTFEGCAIGSEASELTLVSDTGSTYVVPLAATCTPPRPAGPFAVSASASASIEFKNVFTSDQEFTVSTDNPALFAATPVGTLKLAKKATANIAVRLQPAAAGAEEPAGRLMIVCTSMPGIPPWVFYLRGGAVAEAAASAPGTAKSTTRAPSAAPAGKKK